MNSLVPREFPTQRPLTRSFDVFFHLCLNKRLSKQSWGWWLEMLSHPLWHHHNGMCCLYETDTDIPFLTVSDNHTRLSNNTLLDPFARACLFTTVYVLSVILRDFGPVSMYRPCFWVLDLTLSYISCIIYIICIVYHRHGWCFVVFLVVKYPLISTIFVWIPLTKQCDMTNCCIHIQIQDQGCCWLVYNHEWD